MKNLHEINAIVSGIRQRIQGLLKNLKLENVPVPTFSLNALQVSQARGFSLCSPEVGINDILTMQVVPVDLGVANLTYRFCGLDRAVAQGSVPIDAQALNEPTELIVKMSDLAVKYLLAPRPEALRTAPQRELESSVSATKYTPWFNLNRVPDSDGVYEMAQRQTTQDGRIKFHCPPNPATIIRMKWDRNLWWRHNGIGWVTANIEDMDDLWVWRGLAEKPTLTNVNIPQDLSFSDRLKMASESKVASTA